MVNTNLIPLLFYHGFERDFFAVKRLTVSGEAAIVGERKKTLWSRMLQPSGTQCTATLFAIEKSDFTRFQYSQRLTEIAFVVQ